MRPKNIDQPSLTYPYFSSGRGYVTRERGRLFLAGFGSTKGSFATSAVFDAERDLRLRNGGASGSWTVSTGPGAAVGDTTGPAGALEFRPSPSSFASAERRSE